MRPDGSLLTVPGYDEQTQLYLVLDPQIILPEIPDYPAYEHARQAVDQLGDLLSEFPFKDRNFKFLRRFVGLDDSRVAARDG